MKRRISRVGKEFISNNMGFSGTDFGCVDVWDNVQDSKGLYDWTVRSHVCDCMERLVDLRKPELVNE